MAEHIPVMLQEVIEGLNIKPNGIYLDLTLGRAGHSSVILSKLDKDGLLIGVDQDEEAIVKSTETLKQIAPNFKIVRDNFSHINEILDNLDIGKVDGILMDLGVSSPQFDNGERGFSYKIDGPLDMRMDKRQTLTAYTIVNTYSVEELTRILRDYGDEKFAYSIAKNIVKYREYASINTTLQLVDIIKRSKPMKELSKLGHPAKQTFQALRIATNDEINVLVNTIDKALERLNPKGRLAIITFHSGEDRIVKSKFKAVSEVIGDRIDGPMKEVKTKFSLVNRKPIEASDEELVINHRSKSAKLRIIEAK